MSVDPYRDNRGGAPTILAALFSNATVDPLLAPYGLFVLRVAVGFDWIVHAFLKTSRGMETHAALLPCDEAELLRLKNAIGTRPVWLTFATPKGDVTVLERAYDVQDVCIEGQRDTLAHHVSDTDGKLDQAYIIHPMWFAASVANAAMSFVVTAWFSA